MAVEKIWDGVLEAMRLRVSSATFTAFLAQTQLLELKGEQRVIGVVACHTGMIKDTIERRYVGQLADELTGIVGKPAEISLVVRTAQTKAAATETGPLFHQEVAAATDNRWKAAGLREDYTFDLYAVSGSNQMAFAAAQAVAKRPGLAYNPLFIYGGVGVGKTHLMQAIGHEVVSRGEVVRCCTGEEFTNDLVEAIRFKSTDKVRNKYRKAKALLIDDVQFIAGKPSVQEEFFHTFNAITKDGGQVVMTSDRPPEEIARLEERLRSRFGAGLIVDVGEPDFELRTAILLIKAKQMQLELPMEAAQTIATHITGVRELQGFLMRLLSGPGMAQLPVSVERVREVLQLGSTTNGVTKLVSPQEVLGIICGFYSVSLPQLKSERRTKTLAWPRQVAMYFLVKEMKLPQEEVGRLLGGRDHTTVIHARDKVITKLETDEQFRREFDLLKRKVVGNVH